MTNTIKLYLITSNEEIARTAAHTAMNLADELLIGGKSAITGLSNAGDSIESYWHNELHYAKIYNRPFEVYFEV